MLEVKLSKHFTLDEFIKLDKYGYHNYPTMQIVANLSFGVATILEPLRLKIGKPIIINSGYRCPTVNKQVGGVANSQHLTGCAADIRCQDNNFFSCTIEFLRQCTHVDQLLTGKNWCHVSWTPFGTPRNQVILNYYK